MFNGCRSFWSESERELDDIVARTIFRVVVLELFAPRVGPEAGEGGVVLVPFADELLEVARAHKPHIHRGVRQELTE